jgi:hypothetical protein
MRRRVAQREAPRYSVECLSALTSDLIIADAALIRIRIDPASVYRN